MARARTKVEEAMMQNKKYVSYDEGAKLYSFGRCTFIRMAHEAGAVRKYGKRALVNREIMDEFVETLSHH